MQVCVGDTGPDATDKLVSQFYAHVGQPIPKTAKKGLQKQS